MRLDSTWRIVVLAVFVAALGGGPRTVAGAAAAVSSPPVAEGVGLLPASVVRVSWTDWSRVQGEADGDALDAESSARDVEDVPDRAFELDLAGTSSLISSFPGMRKNFGVSPLDAEWEVYGQADDGSVALLRFDDDVDLAALEGRLEGLGYEAPADGPARAGPGSATWTRSPASRAR